MSFRRGVRLGVDVGSVRVGLAVCDPDGMIASPVETLRRDTARRTDVARIAAEVVERGAIEVVLGMPRSLSGAEGPAARAAVAYAEQVATAVAPVPVRMVDERLTTVSAHRALHDAGRRGRRHREVVDQVAAVLVLQSAIDAEHVSGTPAGTLIGSSPQDVMSQDGTSQDGAARG